ncbi:hypothetical protein POM88_019643 [Heracleum sosnowskyi]|uniref:Uncharacterized protein n=1 Tax=Heracleum sosnowskyi TaxID=360622 RepID=A0AAD8IB18_9APIA|nr:hypothetical protein POM88_019643 [Heracleum sosnowskyi]
MGQYFCCMKQPSSQDESKRVNPYDSNCSTPVFPISKMKIKQEQIHLTSPAARKVAVTEPLTLEQCLMDSPNLNISRCTNKFGGNDQPNVVEKYQKINLSSPDLRNDFFTPRLSFSSDKFGLLRKIDEDDDEGSCGNLVGGKVKKRVSFKLPEEADIIVFYSPKEMFEEY